MLEVWKVKFREARLTALVPDLEVVPPGLAAASPELLAQPPARPLPPLGPLQPGLRHCSLHQPGLLLHLQRGQWTVESGEWRPNVSKYTPGA